MQPQQVAMAGSTNKAASYSGACTTDILMRLAPGGSAAGPTITAGLITQLLSGSKLIDVDYNVKADRDLM